MGTKAEILEKLILDQVKEEVEFIIGDAYEDSEINARIEELTDCFVDAAAALEGYSNDYGKNEIHAGAVYYALLKAARWLKNDSSKVVKEALKEIDDLTKEAAQDRRFWYKDQI